MDPQDAFIFGESFGAADWLEAVGLFAPNQLSIGKQRAVATLTGYVEDFSKIKACIHFLRGYAWVDESKNLRRSLPARHPIWPNLVCTEILECTGVQFDKKQDIIDDSMDLPYALYKKFKVTASFQSPPYVILADGDALTEDDRWTTFQEKPYVDNFAVPNGQQLFDGGPYDGTPIPYPLVIRTQKSVYELKWFEVPASFVRNPDGAMPKIDAAVGKINSDVYAGKAIGTFLVDEPDVEMYNDPIVGDMLGTSGRFLNVTLRFRFYDPALGAGTTHGWTTALGFDGKVYPTKPAVAGGNALFLSTSFAKLFTHWSL